MGYQDVLAALKQKGISIRVASPKLVMEEVFSRCFLLCVSCLLTLIIP
jgi:hypothetical protein